MGQRTSFRILLASLMVMLGAATLTAKELKLGYLDSDRVLEANDDFKAAKQKLQDEEKQYITQAQAMEKLVHDLGEELTNQSLMLSDDARAERQGRLLAKQNELDQFRKETWGEGGKLYNRNLELSKPVLDKINAAIEKVSQAEGYDFVFDAASANIVFALPDYDLTDKVIEELKKE